MTAQTDGDANSNSNALVIDLAQKLDDTGSHRTDIQVSGIPNYWAGIAKQHDPLSHHTVRFGRFRLKNLIFDNLRAQKLFINALLKM